MTTKVSFSDLEQEIKKTKKKQMAEESVLN